MKVAAIELFAGAGGLGLGAKAAGADVRLAVELDPIACATLEANRRRQGARVLRADVARLSGAELRSLAQLQKGQPLILTGGPPCQPFSKAAYWTDPGDDAKFRRAREAGIELPRPAIPPVRPDRRRSLVKEFFRLVRETKADGFVFENVPSIAHPRHRPLLTWLLRAAAREGFCTTQIKANAVLFGVPQRRERVFVLAAKTGHPIPPRATHGESGPKRPVTAGEALADISAAPEPEEVVTGKWADHLRAVPPGWNYKAHTAWAGHKKPTFVTETRFWNFLLKLDPDRPSWTIAANPGPWTGPFHWDSRRLRTAELAVLQGFPADYVFHGTRRERVRQIGNAAPPPLVAPMVAAVLKAITASRVWTPDAPAHQLVELRV